MKRKRTHVDYLLDVLDNIEKTERFVGGVTEDEFQANDEKVYAVVHALQTIGEAARHLPKSLRQRYASVDWDDIVGMRDNCDPRVFWRGLGDYLADSSKRFGTLKISDQENAI